MSYTPPPEQTDRLCRVVLGSIAADHFANENDPHADAHAEHLTEQVALAARELARAVDALDPDRWPVGWAKPADHDARSALVSQLASAHAKVEHLRLELAGVSFPPDRYVLAARDKTIRLYCRTCATGNPEDYVCEWWEGQEATTPFERPLTMARTHEVERHGRKWDEPKPAEPAKAVTTWTGPDGTVYDLGHGLRDADGDVWVCTGWFQPYEGDPVPFMEWSDDRADLAEVVLRYGPLTTCAEDCIQPPDIEFLLPHVVAEQGALTPIPSKIEPEPTHYGKGTHGGIAPHKGTRENCPAPECLDAEADEREERDEETRRVRTMLDSVNRYISRHSEADDEVRASLWRAMVGATEDVADLFESRIADLDHRAAQLPDGGLATKP